MHLVQLYFRFMGLLYLIPIGIFYKIEKVQLNLISLINSFKVYQLYALGLC